MDKIRIWGIVISVGAVVALIGIGTALSGAGLDEEEQVDEEWPSVDNLHVYYLEMSCSGGKLVDMEYAVAAGTMTVQILTEEGLDELLEVGSITASNVLFSRTSQSSGTFEWTPPETDKYNLVFYDFSQTGTTVTASGTFTGASNGILYAGIGIIVAGIIIAVVGAIKRQKLANQKDATMPQDVVMYPSAPPMELTPKEPPKP